MKNLFVKKEAENYNEYSKVSINDCVDFEILKLFLFS